MRENYNYYPDIEEIDCNMNTGLIAPKSAAPRKTYFGTPDQAIRYNSKAADTAINKILAAQGDLPIDSPGALSESEKQILEEAGEICRRAAQAIQGGV